jgi:hypothetical protein
MEDMQNMEIVQQGNQRPAALPPDIGQAFTQMVQAVRGLADMMRATNERMTSLEQQVRLLTKVTPMQAGEINAAIRERAVELCDSYHAPGCEKAVMAAIRRAVRLMQGVQNVRDLPRCEYAVALQQARLWDDYKTMKAIKAKGK